MKNKILMTSVLAMTFALAGNVYAVNQNSNSGTGTGNQVEQQTQTANQGDQQTLTEQIQTLEQANLEIENSLGTAQKGFSLFGWMFRMFSN